jgi:hypothetical protein
MKSPHISSTRKPGTGRESSYGILEIIPTLFATAASSRAMLASFAFSSRTLTSNLAEPRMEGIALEIAAHCALADATRFCAVASLDLWLSQFARGNGPRSLWRE